jgi:hypothetical protein
LPGYPLLGQQAEFLQVPGAGQQAAVQRALSRNGLVQCGAQADFSDATASGAAWSSEGGQGGGHRLMIERRVSSGVEIGSTLGAGRKRADHTTIVLSVSRILAKLHGIRGNSVHCWLDTTLRKDLFDVAPSQLAAGHRRKSLGVVLGVTLRCPLQAASEDGPFRAVSVPFTRSSLVVPTLTTAECAGAPR